MALLFVPVSVNGQQVIKAKKAITIHRYASAEHHNHSFAVKSDIVHRSKTRHCFLAEHGIAPSWTRHLASAAVKVHHAACGVVRSPYAKAGHKNDKPEVTLTTKQRLLL